VATRAAAVRGRRAAAATSGTMIETAARVELAGGDIDYILRRSPRARALRVVIHPDRGVVVTVPISGRRGWSDPERHVAGFLRDREAWLRRHLDRHARARAVLVERGGLRDGATIRYRGELHTLRVRPAATGTRRSSVARVGGEDGDELVVRQAAADRRPVGVVLDAWMRERAREAIERDVTRHAVALGVAPTSVTVRDQRTRWGSASREGRLSFSWRLILAPPEALETVVIHELAHLRLFGHGPRFWEIVASRRPDHVTWRHWLRDHSVELHGALDEPEGGPVPAPMAPLS
jgi:predicted metal-dependent hydrolase